MYISVKLKNGTYVDAKVVSSLNVGSVYLGNDVWKGTDGNYYLVW